MNESEGREKKMLARALVVFGCALLVFLVLAGVELVKRLGGGDGPGASSEEESRPVVICTTFAAYDWAREIASGTSGAEVKYLVDSAADMHSYSPSAADVLEYKGAASVLAIGGESEEWLDDLGLGEGVVVKLVDCAGALEEEVPEGAAAEEEESEEVEYDEHVWLSLRSAERCCKEICEVLCGLSPSESEAYRSNLEGYLKRLRALDEEYTEAVEEAPRKSLVFADRFPFRYMAEDYGLECYAAFSGCSAESEASFETVKFLAEKAKELGLGSVCAISEDHPIADSVAEAAGGLGIVVFDSMQSIPSSEAGTVSYTGAMEKNLEALREALND